MSKYPIADRVTELRPQLKAIGEFLEWLQLEKKIQLCRWHTETQGYEPDYHTIEDWLALYFEIDQVGYEREKRAMLDELRAAQEARHVDSD